MFLSFFSFFKGEKKCWLIKTIEVQQQEFEALCATTFLESGGMQSKTISKEKGKKITSFFSFFKRWVSTEMSTYVWSVNRILSTSPVFTKVVQVMMPISRIG